MTTSDNAAWSLDGLAQAVLPLVRQAQRWVGHIARTASGDHRALDPATKALQALAFALSVGGRSFSVPSKLVGVAACQAAVRALASAPFGLLLRAHVERGAEGRETRIRVEGGLNGSVSTLGYLQSKHVPWVLPLLPFGLEIRLIRVTGDPSQGHTLGVNIAFAGVDEALKRSAGRPTPAGEGAEV